MDELTYLRDLVVILGFGVLIVAVFHRFKLPSVAGFILAGTFVGPQGLGLVNDIHQVEVLAEIGVALLLFSIGLELSLDRLRRLWKLILMGGLLQVGLSILVAFLVSRLFGLPGNTAIFIGFLVALSSTAIVLRGLQRRGEVDAPHGRFTLGILVFQDFAVVPMMLAIPMLSDPGAFDQSVLGSMARSVAIVIGVFLAAYLIVPRVLRLVTMTRQRQLFILTVFLICIGTAWLITSSGASFAIGAFLAGLVVAGSEYRHQALADLLSFREVFASLFFVSIGMLLAPLIFIENIIPIMLLLAAIMIGKAVIVFATAFVLRLPLRVCLLAAVALAQVGEFSFVLSYAAKGTGLIDVSLESNLISAAILSMFLTPFAISFGSQLAAGVGKLHRLTHLLEVPTAEDAAGVVRTMSDHVIIGGYGFAGRELAQALIKCEIPLVIVDLNVENVRKAARETGDAYFGDVTSHEVLEKLEVARAKELVLLINDPGAAEHAVRVARRLAPDLFILVRTHYLLDIESLLAVGADEVIAAEREAAVEVTSFLLSRRQVDSQLIVAQCCRIRGQSEEESG